MNKKQRNCLYCHEQADHCAEPIAGGFNDIGCGLVHADGNWYMSSWDFDVMKVADEPAVSCPVCGRNLRSEEE